MCFRKACGSQDQNCYPEATAGIGAGECGPLRLAPTYPVVPGQELTADACSALGSRPGTGCCNGVPTNLMTSDAHCGQCNNAVAPGATCCGGIATQTSTDSMHCGRCGNAIPPGSLCCAGTSINPAISRQHCGSCNNPVSEGSDCCAGTIKALHTQADCSACAIACSPNTLCRDCAGLWTCVGSTVPVHPSWQKFQASHPEGTSQCVNGRWQCNTELFMTVSGGCCPPGTTRFDSASNACLP